MNPSSPPTLAGIALCFCLASCQANALADIIPGTNNGDGTWSLGSLEMRLIQEPAGKNLVKSLEISEAGTPHAFGISIGNNGGWRRDDNFSQSFTSGNSKFPYFILRPTGGDTVNGSTVGSENWILISLEVGEQEWDTAVQLVQGSDPSSLTGDAILNVWHDNSRVGENVLAGASSFSEIGSSSVPEPSTLVACLIGVVGVTGRRKRNVSSAKARINHF